VVSVDRGGNEEVRRRAAGQRVTFTIAHDPNGTNQQRFQAIGFPGSYLVGTDGRLLWRRVGEHPARDAALAALAALATAIEGALDGG